MVINDSIQKRSKEPKILKKGGEIMKKPNMLKKVICFVIALMMVMPSMPGNTAKAAEIEWPNPGAINLSKIANKVEGQDSRWKVELTVEGKNIETRSDIVLVIDRSGSMKDANKMLLAKTAAKTFINTLLSDPENTKTRIALISYSSDYDKDWWNRSEALTVHSGFLGYSDKDELLSYLDGGNNDGTIVPLGGTFTQAGLKAAEDLLEESNAESKNIVLLSDGEPTYGYAMNDNSKYILRYPDGDKTDNYRKWWVFYKDIYTAYENPVNSSADDFDYDSFKGTGNSLRERSDDIYVGRTGGDGSWSNPYVESYNRLYHNSGNAAISEASIAKNKGQTIYTIALNAGIEGNAVLEAIATPDKAYTANPNDLSRIFNEIAGSITYSARDAVVTDPMGEQFDLVNKNSGEFKWALKGSPEEASADIVISQGEIRSIEHSHPFTVIWDAGSIIEGAPATMTYYVDIHSDAIGNTLYPTNDTTTISYYDVNDDIEKTVKEFEVPKVSVGDTGTIKVVAYLVNSEGEPVASDGTTVVARPDLAKKLDEMDYSHDGSTILPYDTYSIATDELTGRAKLDGYEYSSESSSHGGNQDPTNVEINAVKQNHIVYFGYKVGNYTVTYDGNGNTSGIVPTDSNEYAYNSEVTVKGQESLAKTGYHFTGWNTEADGTGTSYQLDAKFGMPTNDVILYAQWSANTDISYTVEYETEDGTKLLDDKVVTDQTMAMTVTESAEEISGYTVDIAEKSLKLEAEDNVITFVYSPKTDISYTVEYETVDGTKLLADKV
ncbi:MAG TPA: hypothetical protein DCM73_04285, partial [Clostridiales bacterium]|nr:hypothetical protein [Clostridiales bacterium]